MVMTLYDMELDFLGDTSRVREKILYHSVVGGVFLGVRLTILGLFINFLWYDIIFYGWLKFKERMEGEE